jgi:multidrug efflux pump subunit AcrA (membrane-fusion protein)/YHS domain-containing protein
MRLEPVYAGSEPDRKGAVEIGAGQQQLIGVQTDEVKRAPVSHLLRAPGRVTPDDARLYRLIAAADGWIRELGPYSPGAFVKKDQVLATYYVPNFVASMQSFLYALGTNDQAQQGTLAPQRGSPGLNLQLAADSLRSLGMGERQIEEIRRSRSGASEIQLLSPVAGFVVARNVSPEQRFDKGVEMFRIADIGHVWVMTDIFEKDRDFARPGAMAKVRYQGREFPARLSDALPQLDPQTRTLKARFELDNPGNVLRPDVFVDVELEVHLPAAVTVPPDAVIDTGRRKTVFVDRGNGYFEPRPVETGWRLGDRVEITKGLEPGEHIVVSGNFLIDSESRMRLTPVGAVSMAEKTAAEKDPVCGMDVDPKDPKAIKTQHGGKTYYFCSDHCKRSFEADPGKYVPKQKKAGKQPAHDAQGGRAPA